MALNGDQLGIAIWDVLNALSGSEKQDTEEVWKLISTEITNHIESKLGNVPIGAIVAWHKSFPNTPALLDGFVECNGQTLDDGDSVYDGQIIPDLNGGAKFLRGSSASGTNQSHQFETHKHALASNIGWPVVIDQGAGHDWAGWATGANWNTLGSVENPSTGNSGAETRPINMSVVWILRIK